MHPQASLENTHMSKRANITRTNSGMAMVMMLVLVPILMFLAMSFVDPIVRSFRSTVNDQKTLLAKNVADSMFEVALWESRGAGIGENVHNENWPEGEVFEYDFGDATVRWSVMGTPSTDEDKLIDEWYTIPSPGSGTAGDDYCNTNEPVVDPDSLNEALNTLEIDSEDLGSNYTALDWPCNWNKLREGENIEIPLYTQDAEGHVLNPQDLGLDTFELTIRTPCNPEQINDRSDEYTNEICRVPYASGERYVLEGDNPGAGVDTVIVLWEITGKQGDETGDSVVIGQLDTDNIFSASKFTAKVLNGNHPFFTSLKQSAKGNKNYTDVQIGPELQNLYKPVLRIIPVHTLQDLNGTVPYLEYQFKARIDTSLDKPVSNTSKVVHVEVMIDGGYSVLIERTVGIAKSVSGFVIQQ